VFAPCPIGKDVDILHRKVKGLAQQMFERANDEYSTLKRLGEMDRYLVELAWRGGVRLESIISSSRVIMPPKAMSQVAIKRLVTQSVDVALEAKRASRVNERGQGSNANERRGQDRAPPVHECTFSSFMKCNPTPFHGKEGAIELCRWYEKSKMVFSISDCAERNKDKEKTERLKKKLRESQQEKEQIEQSFRHVIDWIRKQFGVEIPPCKGDDDATTPDNTHP
nr:hypothetical protein [Tanacetum cinerariifolium]